MKSKISVRFIGPMYQSMVYMNSNNLLEPVQTPKQRANEGMKRAPTNHASVPSHSPFNIKFNATPLPVIIAKNTPASHTAGNCRVREFAEEKII